MKHLAFLYYVISYSIGLPTLAVVIITFLKTKNRILKYFLPFLISVTLQLVFTTILRYQDVTHLYSNTYPNIGIKYLYLLSESSIIFTLPIFCHVLFSVKRTKLRNLSFGTLFVLSLGIIFSPYFLKYIPEQHQLSALPGFEIYRGIFFFAVLYSIIMLFFSLRKITEKHLRWLAIISLVFMFVSLVEILHCELLPILKHAQLPIPLSPLCYLVLNIVFLVLVVKNFLLIPVTIPNFRNLTDFKQYQLTNREKEIINLLIQGFQNKEISQKLFISESTVKTHIQNIYKKLGIQNRVQLVNSFKGIS
jgi:DNA-binding CsgD family transcriptional regulator